MSSTNNGSGISPFDPQAYRAAAAQAIDAQIAALAHHAEARQLALDLRGALIAEALRALPLRHQRSLDKSVDRLPAYAVSVANDVWLARVTARFPDLLADYAASLKPKLQAILKACAARANLTLPEQQREDLLLTVTARFYLELAEGLYSPAVCGIGTLLKRLVTYELRDFVGHLPIPENFEAELPASSELSDAQRAQLDAVLAELPEAQRMAVLMHTVGRLSHREIAEKIGKTENNSRQLLLRGLKRLRLLLGGMGLLLLLLGVWLPGVAVALVLLGQAPAAAPQMAAVPPLRATSAMPVQYDEDAIAAQRQDSLDMVRGRSHSTGIFTQQFSMIHEQPMEQPAQQPATSTPQMPQATIASPSPVARVPSAALAASPRATPAPSASPRATLAPLPSPRATPMQDAAPQATARPPRRANPTVRPKPSATATALPSATATALPTAMLSATTRATATSTVVPSATAATSPAAPSATAVPSATATSPAAPSATAVPSATATSTAAPSATATSTAVPSATATMAATSTTVPSATAMPTVTATVVPSATASTIPSATVTPTAMPTATATPCPPDQIRPLDIGLTIDASQSMGDEHKLDYAIDAAVDFIDLLQDQDQVALVSFKGSPTLESPLSSDHQSVIERVRTLQPSGSTRIDAAINTMADELASTRHRTEAQSVLILLTDGLANNYAAEAQAAAEQAKARNIRLITIGIGQVDSAYLDAALLQALASSDADYYEAHGGAELPAIYASIQVLIHTCVAATEQQATPTVTQVQATVTATELPPSPVARLSAQALGLGLTAPTAQRLGAQPQRYGAAGGPAGHGRPCEHRRPRGAAGVRLRPWRSWPATNAAMFFGTTRHYGYSANVAPIICVV